MLQRVVVVCAAGVELSDPVTTLRGSFEMALETFLDAKFSESIFGGLSHLVRSSGGNMNSPQFDRHRYGVIHVGCIHGTYSS